MSEQWWGRFEMREGRRIQWLIGPLEAWLEARDTEWILGYRYVVPEEDADRAEVIAEAPPMAGDCTIERFVSARLPQMAVIKPALADRSVVSRPQVPFRLLAGDQIQLFVGNPLWFRLELPNDGPCLRELPINRPSDTWFGPSTREGELCYATRTHARLTIEEIPTRPHRATTPVTLINRAEDAMLLERISLPVPLLSAYCIDPGNIWTSAVALERREDREMAELKILPGAPQARDSASLLFKARQAGGRNVVLKTLSSLLS